MTSFFLDVNVWLALSDNRHAHHGGATHWANSIPDEDRFIFSRVSQIGLLRLLTSESVMGEEARTIEKAWGVFDRWMADPRVMLYPEPRNLDVGFRHATASFRSLKAPKTWGDCYFLAFTQESDATLVTFDKALVIQAKRTGCTAIVPA